MEIEKINRYVGNKIKEQRIFLGLTQEELAKKVGVGKTTISNYEVGLRSPKKPQMIKLSEVFGISIDDFFPSVNPQNNNVHSDIPSLSSLTEQQQEQLLKLSKLDLDDSILNTVELMSKADDKFRDKIHSYAKFEYFEYEKELEQKNKNNRNSAC
ncbi:helix-turn-helix transcriptional regulator [Lactococcus lactis]|uniref:helix-turn-helix transcriptional regulator n=1 Tax=Lactococcus lactis TaxID=1358 RepID=UPI001EF6E7BC|nr:helix-turn-helix transcriptional regulator [Lactococcus lactis]